MMTASIKRLEIEGNANIKYLQETGSVVGTAAQHRPRAKRTLLRKEK
jgi:hypothetical protein